MEIVVSPQLLDTLPARMAALTQRCAVIADENTYKALTPQIGSDICAQAGGSLIMLPDDVSPALTRAQSLIEPLRAAGFGVAIGSGTINDIVKYAAFHADVPYVVIATAPSMNGYISSSASLLEGGFKQSYAARSPVAVFADVEVLAAAPMRLIQAGLGDTLCRSTVEFDCLLSHYCLDTAYSRDWFAPLAPYETQLLTHSAQLFHREPATIKTLFDALLTTGHAMLNAGSSVPASQGEHMLAHTMDYLEHTHSIFHGEAIAVTTLTMAQIQASLLESAPVLYPTPLSDEARTWLPASALKTYHLKQFDDEKYRKINARLQKDWPEISAHLRSIHIAPTQLESALLAAGCPTTPAAIGWHHDTYTTALRLAKFTRERFTALDVN